jgi:hypothetical protein
LGLLGGCTHKSASIPKPPPSPALIRDWKGHLQLIDEELRQGRHLQLAERYAIAREKHDSPMLRAGHAQVIAWWQRLEMAGVENRLLPSLPYALIEALRKDMETTREAFIPVALYNLEETTIEVPYEPESVVRKREEESRRTTGLSVKERRLQLLLERAQALEPENLRIRAMATRFIKDPRRRLEILEAAHAAYPKALGILVHLTRTAKEAGKPELAAKYQARLRAEYAKVPDSVEARLIARLEPKLVK